MDKQMEEQIYGKTINGQNQTLEQLEAKANAYDFICWALSITAEGGPDKDSPVMQWFQDKSITMEDIYGPGVLAYYDKFLKLLKKVVESFGNN